MRLGSYLVFVLVAMPATAQAESATCSYDTYKWNVYQRQAVARQRVQHSYSKLANNERDEATGCTVCEEDQQWIALPGLQPFRMCRRLAYEVEPVLIKLVEQGEPIHKIVGYRVGMTRGGIDAQGNRTRFSNHSFGIAIDINDEQNGLYDRCINFGPQCRLIKGGPWIPGQPGSLESSSTIVRELSQAGLHWGGRIAGKQKDFMHFSPSGY